MRPPSSILGLGFGLSLVLGGCSSGPAKAREYLLAARVPAATSREGPKLPPLRVKPLVPRGFLDRSAIAWREGDVRSGAYQYLRWSEPPAEAATRALVDALRARGAFEQVDTAAARTSGRCTLSGELLGFHEESDEQGGHAAGVAELELVVEIASDDPAAAPRRRIVRARHAVAAGDETMEALVRAVSAALEQTLAELLPQVEAAAAAR